MAGMEIWPKPRQRVQYLLDTAWHSCCDMAAVTCQQYHDFDGDNGLYVHDLLNAA